MKNLETPGKTWRLAGLCKAPRAYRYGAIEILTIIIIVISIVINDSACLFVLVSPTVANPPLNLQKQQKLHNVSALYIATLNTIFKFVFLLHVTH